MKDKARSVTNHAALFRVCIKSSEAAGLDEIRISVPRAKEILRDLEILKSAIESPSVMPHQSRLDTIFGNQIRVIDEAVSKLI